MIGDFSKQSWEEVQNLLFAEGQTSPLLGECNQKKRREAMATQRTPAQQEADRNRSQQQRGKSTQSSSVRSEAAKKAAETRRRCRKGGSTTGPSMTA